MKTIGYVLAAFPVLSETFIGTEMRAMEQQGHRVVPIVLTKNDFPGQDADKPLVARALYLPDFPHQDGLQALLRPSLTAVRGLAFWIAQCKSPRRSLLWTSLRIAALARATGCDHLHGHFAGPAAAHAIVAARWMGVPVSFTGHGHDIYAICEDLPEKLQATDAAIAVCNDMAAEFLRLAPTAAVSMIPCGVNPNRFQPGEQQDNGRYLFIGRLVEAKGLDDLFQALHQIKMAQRQTVPVDIIGDGPLRQELEREAARLGIAEQVRFLGARPNQWIAAEAPAYRALLCPFKPARNGERDSGPVVAKEAMAMGLPVIATRFMGFKEMITPETGVLVPVGDPAALAGAILAFDALPPSNRYRLGQAGRARLLALFTDTAQARALSAVIENLPQRRPNWGTAAKGDAA